MTDAALPTTMVMQPDRLRKSKESQMAAIAVPAEGPFLDYDSTPEEVDHDVTDVRVSFACSTCHRRIRVTVPFTMQMDVVLAEVMVHKATDADMTARRKAKREQQRAAALAEAVPYSGAIQTCQCKTQPRGRDWWGGRCSGKAKFVIVRAGEKLVACPLHAKDKDSARHSVGSGTTWRTSRSSPSTCRSAVLPLTAACP